MNFAGRSVVSAITQTPASGPFALVTTPPMSSLSIATVAAPFCCAWTPVKEATEVARTHATANKLNLGLTRNFICSSVQISRARHSVENQLGFLLRRAYTQSL